MLGRVLACTIAMGIAAPAFAADGNSHAVARVEAMIQTPDTMPLLMQDARATWGTAAPLAQLAPGFAMAAPITVTAAPPVPGDLASFEALDSPAATYSLPASGEQPETLAFAPARYTLAPGIRLTARARAEPMGGATGALGVANAIPRPYRPRRSPFDTMLVFRLDGETSSPAFSFGGGVASVLNVLPRH